MGKVEIFGNVFGNLFLKKKQLNISGEEPQESSASVYGLNLLFEATVNLDCLIPVVEKNTSFSSCSDLLVFEVFGQQFCEALLAIKQPKEVVIQRRLGDTSTTKSSYSLRTLTRLHDFQRVIWFLIDFY